MDRKTLIGKWLEAHRKLFEAVGRPAPPSHGIGFEEKVMEHLTQLELLLTEVVKTQNIRLPDPAEKPS